MTKEHEYECDNCNYKNKESFCFKTFQLAGLDIRLCSDCLDKLIKELKDL